MIIDANPDSKDHHCYFESASVGMSVYTAGGQWLNVNREFCRMLGYSREEIFCKSWKEIIHPDDLDLCYDNYKGILEGKTDNYYVSHRIVKKDGSVIHATVHVVCGRNSDRSVSHLIATYIDNTENYQIREKQKREYELLRLVIDNLNSGVYLLDRNGRKIISNKIDVIVSGCDREDKVLGKTLRDIFTGPAGEASHTENMEVLRTGKSIINDERVFRSLDGSIRNILISKIPIIEDHEEITGLIGFGYDITDLRNMESKARTSEEYYKTLIEVSPYGIIITDAKGHVNYASRNAYRIFCVPETEDISGMSIFDFVTSEDMEQALINFRESVAGIRTSKKWEYRFIRYDKTEFWCEVITALLRDSDGNFKGLMIICNDINERKLAEEELISAKKRIEQSDRFKTALLRNISHEIRTPLNAILGFSELITDPGLSEQTKASYIEIINKSSSQLLSTIDSLVDLSTIQAKITSKKISEVNINEILAGIHNQFHLKAARKNIQINVICGLQDQEAVVRTDRMKLFQVLSHLTSNALKFTWYGQISIECHLVDKFIEFSVTDTGIGIPEEFHSRIFDTFFRVDNDRDIKNDGIGMGLPICQAYVELIGGKIWFKSEPGKGSEFFFTIPYERAKPYNEETAPERLFKGGATVLVVDDLETNLRYLADLLMMSDIKVLLARNGIDAVERCREEERIDLVLMDLRMPLMDGFEAITHIKDFRPGLPVIAQSAYVGEKEMALNSGFDDFLCKPFTRQQITALLHKYL